MELYKHQIDALEKTKDLNRVAYYHDMGLGKTFTGAEKMHRLNKRNNLLICQKSKINDWIEHFEQYYPNYKVYDLTKPKELSLFCGMCQSERYYTIGIINYQLAWRRSELKDIKNFTLILDESSLVQNDTAKQSRFILRLKPVNVILLSGTPVGGKYENLWSQCILLGWNIKKKEYNERYVNWVKLNVGTQCIDIVDKKNPYKNIDELKHNLHINGADFLLTNEVIDLPEQVFTNIKVNASKEYKKFLQDDIVYIDGDEILGQTPLTKMLSCRKLCSIYSQEKLQAFEDLLQSTNDRLIVFYNFNEECNRLIEVCKRNNRPVSLVNGNSKELNHYEMCDNSVTLIQYQAGAMGLNLQKANKIVYYSLTLSSELFEQSKKRIHRIGQSDTCFYYVMMVKNSIEEQIYRTLQRREDYTLKLFERYGT